VRHSRPLCAATSHGVWGGGRPRLQRLGCITESVLIIQWRLPTAGDPAPDGEHRSAGGAALFQCRRGSQVPHPRHPKEGMCPLHQSDVLFLRRYECLRKVDGK